MGDTEMPEATVAHTPRYYKYILNAHGVSDFEDNGVTICDGEIIIPENIHLQYFIDPFDKVYSVCIQEGDIKKICGDYISYIPNPIYLYRKDSEPKLPDILLGRLDDCESNTGFYDCETEEWKEAAGLGPVGSLLASDSTIYVNCLSTVITSFSIDFAISNPGDIAVLYIAVCNKSLTCKTENALVYYPVKNRLLKHVNWEANVKMTELTDEAYAALHRYYLRRGYSRKNANKKLKALSVEDLLKTYTAYLLMSKGGHRTKSNHRKTRKQSKAKHMKKKYTRRRF